MHFLNKSSCRGCCGLFYRAWGEQCFFMLDLIDRNPLLFWESISNKTDLDQLRPSLLLSVVRADSTRGLWVPPQRFSPAELLLCITLSVGSRGERRPGDWLIVSRQIDWVTRGDRKASGNYAVCRARSLGERRSESLWNGRHKGGWNHIWLFRGINTHTPFCSSIIC